MKDTGWSLVREGFSVVTDKLPRLSGFHKKTYISCLWVFLDQPVAVQGPFRALLSVVPLSTAYGPWVAVSS